MYQRIETRVKYFYVKKKPSNRVREKDSNKMINSCHSNIKCTVLLQPYFPLITTICSHSEGVALISYQSFLLLLTSYGEHRQLLSHKNVKCYLNPWFKLS